MTPLEKLVAALEAYQDAVAEYLLSAPPVEPVYPGPLTTEELAEIDRSLTPDDGDARFDS